MFSSVQSFSRGWLFANPWTAARQAPLSNTNPQSLLKLMCLASVMPSNHLILCRPLLLLPSIFPCIRVFSDESALPIRWPKYWSFSFSISPSNEHPGLISFRMDWLDLLAVQGTLKSLSSTMMWKRECSRLRSFRAAHRCAVRVCSSLRATFLHACAPCWWRHCFEWSSSMALRR